MANKKIHELDLSEDPLNSEDKLVIDQASETVNDETTYVTKSVNFQTVTSQIETQVVNTISESIKPINQIQNLYYPESIAYTSLTANQNITIPFDCAFWCSSCKLSVNDLPIKNVVLTSKVQFTPHNSEFIQIFLQANDIVTMGEGSKACAIPVRTGDTAEELFTEYSIPLTSLFKCPTPSGKSLLYVPYDQLADSTSYALSDGTSTLTPAPVIGWFRLYKDANSKALLRYKIQNNYIVRFLGISNTAGLYFSSTSDSDPWSRITVQNTNLFLTRAATPSWKNMLLVKRTDGKTNCNSIRLTKSSSESWSEAMPKIHLSVYKIG